MLAQYCDRSKTLGAGKGRAFRPNRLPVSGEFWVGKLQLNSRFHCRFDDTAVNWLIDLRPNGDQLDYFNMIAFTFEF